MLHPIVPGTRCSPALPVLCATWKPAAVYLVCQGRQEHQLGDQCWTGWSSTAQGAVTSIAEERLKFTPACALALLDWSKLSNIYRALI